jgi:citrate synthase
MSGPARPPSSSTVDDAAAYVGAREAIALLGIRLPTLYAYVTRGLVRSVPGPSSRGRLYARADLERLKARHDARAGHGAVAADALRWGQPVLDSAITRIDEAGPAYRGHPATELAEAGVPFESVAELLWDGGLAGPPAAAPAWKADSLGFDPERLASMLGPGGAGGSFRRLTTALPILAGLDPDAARAPTPQVERARSRVLLVRLRAALCAEDPARAARALAAPTMAEGVAIALGVGDRPGAVRAVDRCLVVCADHELNASTFAARVAASAGCDLYACLVAALAVLSGTRHGGMSAEVDAALRRIPSPAEARAFVADCVTSGAEIPGFGHRLYPGADGRAEVLLAIARAPAPSPALATLFALLDAMREAGRAPPNLDVGLVALTRHLGLPADAAGALFAIARTAGWIAHVLEQRAAGYLLRPRARYVGV